MTITRIRTRHWPSSTPGCPVQYGVFEDAGGQPSFTPLGVTDWTIQSPTEWQDCELSTPVTVQGGSFYVGIRQVTAQRVDIGMDFCATPQPNTFFAVSDPAGPWTDLSAAGYPQVLVMRAVVMGNVMAGAVELSPTPVEVSQTSSWPVAKAPGSAPILKSGRTASVTTDETEGTEKVPEVPEITANITHAEVHDLYATPGIAAMRPYSESGRDRQTLDEVLRYIIYRGGTRYDSVAATLRTYSDNGHGAGLPENTPYQYAVTARYDNNLESPQTAPVTASCNMAPGVPTSVQGTPVGTSQMRILWADPTVNRDGSPCVDLAGIKVYRDGTFLANVNAGVGQYLDTPPVNDVFYTWEVKGFDEVPNVGEGATFVGAVQSPWRVVDYDWVDITGVGTNTGITADDQNAGPFNLGFNVEFYGNTFNSIRVCGNGWLSFTSTGTNWGNTAIPSTDEPNNALYLFWDDMYPPDGGSILYYADAANQRFIVSWEGIQNYYGTEPYTCQAIIGSRGSILYQYHTIPTSTPSNTNCTVGVENASGTDALQLVYNGTGAFLPTSQTAVEFWGGPSGHLEGIVRTFGSNLPIENAWVWAEDWADTVYSDALGSYTMDLEPGTYTLHVGHMHYCGETYQVVIEDNVTTVRNAVLRAPQAQVSVSSFNVEVMQNLTTQRAFTISNNGGQCALTFSITDTAAWLSASPETGTIEANQSQEILVTFAPGNLPVGSDRQAALVVNYNAVGTPSIINCFMNVLSVTELGGAIPTEFAFRGNYPNPFNPVTQLRFDVPQQSRVDLVVYNVMGQEVARPVSDVFQAGRYEASFDAGNLPSGMYLVRMTAGEYSAMGKMMLLK
ncbi:MAG: T9SS type A sorting domain-containing protein [bacterium]|nr:T9SS type A sorting domain-containing protein [bacterium]